MNGISLLNIILHIIRHLLSVKRSVRQTSTLLSSRISPCRAQSLHTVPWTRGREPPKIDQIYVAVIVHNKYQICIPDIVQITQRCHKANESVSSELFNSMVFAWYWNISTSLEISLYYPCFYQSYLLKYTRNT